MRHFGLRQGLAACALIFAASSQATIYEINSTDDVEVTVARVGSGEETRWELSSAVEDGLCSLREAVYASNYRKPVDGCEAGSAGNIIKLLRDETYVLVHGELPVGGGRQVVFTSVDDDNDPQTPPQQVPSDLADDDELDNALSVEMLLDSFEQVDDQVLPILSAGGNSRIFNTTETGRLTLENIDVTDGGSETLGGLIYASSTVTLNSRTTLRNGQADEGGAVYLDAGSSLLFNEGAQFLDNSAIVRGAAIATADTFTGVISGTRFYMEGNVAGMGAADAGVIYLDGPADELVGIELTNGTITANDGGVLNVAATNHLTVVRNMTIAFNGGTALTLAEPQFADPANAETRDFIQHTVVVGNDTACAGGALVGTVDPDAAARLLFTITDDANCPLPAEQTEGVPVTDNPNSATAEVFLGVGRNACTGTGLGACQPIAAAELGGVYPGFLPNPEPAGLDPLNPSATPSLFDRANPENVVVDRCEANDYRDLPRGGAGGRCDVGAVEYLRAQAAADEVLMVSGQEQLADVVANDLQDTDIDCNRLEGSVCTVGDTACVLAQCLRVIVDPSRGSAVAEIDANGYPQIRYTPFESFHGVDQFRYVVAKEAFVGGTDVGQDQSEIVNMVAEPESGLTEKKSIGSGSALLLGLLSFVGLLRRRLLVGLFSFGLVSGVGAADIEVNSLIDEFPSTPNDGLCTLREALENAGGAGSADCVFGAKGEDRILIPAGDIQLVDTLVIEGGSVVLEGKGARDEDLLDGEDTLTRIIGNGTDRLFEVQAPQSSGFPSATFRYLRLEGGRALGGQDVGAGGAVFSGGTVIFDRVELHDNCADHSGGSVFVRNNAGNAKLITFNRTYVTGSRAGVAGGVVSTTSQTGERLDVALIDSTFDGNGVFTEAQTNCSAGTTADGEGGVLDANIAVGQLAAANSTFVDNIAANGSALALSDLAVSANLMNLTFLNNTGANAIELGDSGVNVSLSNSIVFDSGGACTTGSTILTTSVFNAFSGTACQADTDEDNRSAVSSAVLASAVVNDGDVGADYTAPYLPPVSPTTDTDIVDTGNGGDLASGTSSPVNCRNVDLRGIARTSGLRCDIGAYEYQQITASDDEGSNFFSLDRSVIIDIVGNDLASDGAEIVLLDPNNPGDFIGQFTFEDADIEPNDDDDDDDGDGYDIVGNGDLFVQDSAEPTRYVLSSMDPNKDGATIDFVWDFYNEELEGYDIRCGGVLPDRFVDFDEEDEYEPGDLAEECSILYTPANNGFIPNEDDPSEDDVCVAIAEDRDPPKLAFVYGFSDSNMVSTTVNARVEMSIDNKAPEFEDASILNRAGESVVFDLEVTDPDGDDSTIVWATLNVKNAPMFAQRDVNTGDVVGSGLLLNHPEVGQVTYIPDSNLSTFKDTFTLEVEDSCGGTSRAGTFTVEYRTRDASAGQLGGFLLLGLVALGLRRRRRC